MMGGRLQGKSAIVLGAGTSAPGMSIGRHLAVLFAREGARVLIADVDPKSLQETRDMIRNDGGICEAEVFDATRLEDQERCVAACQTAFGSVDIVQNVIGRGGPGGPREVSAQQWRDSLELNLTSAFFACKAALPVMEKQGGGVFVHIASVAGIRYPGSPSISYQCAKAGLIALSRGVALEFADRGIRSNCVVPGNVDTPQIVQRLTAMHGADKLETVMKRRGQNSPQGRSATTQDVAYAALFLASDESGHINGTELVVDGGKVAQCAKPYA